MTESAKPSKRELTARAIASSAQLLADENGLDGFTMDQLAEAAGVSRRTLFNYYPSKIDAILGARPEHDPELVASFLAGGPTGHLVTDVKGLALAILSSREVSVEEFARFRRLLSNEPRIMHAAHTRFAEASEQFVAAIIEREGPDADIRKARIIARIILGTFDLALDAFLEDQGKSTIAEEFSHTFDTLKELLS
jgi:AcrR family transcriptional regulator